MSTTGKVFVFLNLVGLIGLTYVAAMVYGKTKEWSYAAYRLQLYRDGLPFDDKETDDKGNALVNNISDQTKNEIFQGTGASPVVTQREEVERVRKIVEGKINAAKDDTDRMKALADVLLVLARNEHERERLIAIRTNLDSADSLAELKKHLGDSVRPAVALAALADPKAQRTFLEAYPEAVLAMRGDASVPEKAVAFRVEPKGPFEEALLVAFAHGKTGAEMAKALDDAVKAVGADAGKKGSEETFLRNARGDKGKAYDKLFEECFGEAMESIKTELQASLKRYFDEPLEGKRIGGDGKPLSIEERRVAAASLLFNLVEADPEFKMPADPAADAKYKRVLATVGIRRFNQTIDRQGELMAKMIEDEDREITAERERFIMAHRDLLKVVQDRAADLTMDKARLADQELKLAESKKLADAQLARVKQYEKFVADRRMETAQKMDHLRKMTKDLFQRRIVARDATVDIQKQEAQIRSLESQFKKTVSTEP
jgi:hypothetical protein